MRIADFTDVFTRIAPAGHYAAVRLGFFSPEEESNAFSQEWIHQYTVNGLALHDPLMRWVYSGSGARRWSALDLPDTMNVLASYAEFGMSYGAVVCVTADDVRPSRTFGYFARNDRELTDAEIADLEATLRALHLGDTEEAPGLTRAQAEALRLLSRGMRLKQIAFALEISESAVKARLKSAVGRMDARTPAQAAALAAEKGWLK